VENARTIRHGELLAPRGRERKAAGAISGTGPWQARYTIERRDFRRPIILHEVFIMADRKASGLASDAGAQLAELRDTIADLGERVAEITAARTREARRSARSAAKSMRASGGSLYEDGAEALGAAGDAAVYYGRRAGSVVRQNPGLSMLGLAVGVGIIAAIVYASQEDDRRWYERRGGWF
jgi:hypothetical protein